MMKAIKEIFEVYVDNVSFLWMKRSQLLVESKINKAEVATLEKRLHLQFNGLKSDLNAAWDAAVEALGYYGQVGGEVFTATVIAFHSGDIDKIKIAITAGRINEENFDGAVTALAWLPDHIVQPWITKFLRSKDLDHKHLALSVCRIRQDDPAELLSEILQRQDCLAHPQLHISALKLIGELRRFDLVSALNAARLSDNHDIRYQANQSATLLRQLSTGKKLPLTDSLKDEASHSRYL